MKYKQANKNNHIKLKNLDQTIVHQFRNRLCYKFGSSCSSNIFHHSAKNIHKVVKIPDRMFK